MCRIFYCFMFFISTLSLANQFNIEGNYSSGCIREIVRQGAVSSIVKLNITEKEVTQTGSYFSDVNCQHDIQNDDKYVFEYKLGNTIQLESLSVNESLSGLEFDATTDDYEHHYIGVFKFNYQDGTAALSFSGGKRKNCGSTPEKRCTDLTSSVFYKVD